MRLKWICVVSVVPGLMIRVDLAVDNVPIILVSAVFVIAITKSAAVLELEWIHTSPMPHMRMELTKRAVYVG